MRGQLLQSVNNRIREYQDSHKGEKPLYIIVSPYEAEALADEVRAAEGHSPDVLVTEYQGSKIVKHDALKKGDVQLSNELPDVSG